MVEGAKLVRAEYLRGVKHRRAPQRLDADPTFGALTALWKALSEAFLSLADRSTILIWAVIPVSLHSRRKQKFGRERAR
jgi:hypothetical protein